MIIDPQTIFLVSLILICTLTGYLGSLVYQMYRKSRGDLYTEEEVECLYQDGYNDGHDDGYFHGYQEAISDMEKKKCK